MIHALHRPNRRGPASGRSSGGLLGSAGSGRARPCLAAVVPVAYEVASRLGAPLDIFLVRKLGAPVMKKLAMGAISRRRRRGPERRADSGTQGSLTPSSGRPRSANGSSSIGATPSFAKAAGRFLWAVNW